MVSRFRSARCLSDLESQIIKCPVCDISSRSTSLSIRFYCNDIQKDRLLIIDRNLHFSRLAVNRLLQEKEEGETL